MVKLIVMLLLLVSVGCASTTQEYWTVERKNRADRANELGRATAANAARGGLTTDLQLPAPQSSMMFSCTSAQLGQFANTDCF